MASSTEVQVDCQAIEDFQQTILSWYATFRRDLPWRRDSDPYRVLVREVMLQQTGVSRIADSYTQFLERFPTVNCLASASTADVLRAWRGLGYNRRAVNLRRAAEVIVRDHGGNVPSTVAALEELPGIGKYTARAVACFAFGQDVPVVDTNVRRVLSGFVGRDLSERETWELAARVLPKGTAVDWNQALMDYGALAQKSTPKRTGKTTQPFETTNRFWRGRIIDVLREHHVLSMEQLLNALPYPERDESRVRGLVRLLHEEGMVEYDADSNAVALPR